MPAKPPPPANLGPTLPCGQCGYENEPERVYCHNCGSKLDRSLLPKVAPKDQEHPEKIRKRVQRMTNPNSGWIWRETKMLFKLAFFSALLAAGILVFWEPDDLPEIKKSEELRLLSSDMMEVMGSPTPARVSFSDNDVNQFLQKSIKTQDTVVPGIQLVHGYVACKPGVLHIYAEYSVLGISTYSRIDYQLPFKDGKLAPKIVGGAFGRLSIDPQLMQYGDYAFGTLWTSLDREHKEMDKFQSISVQDGRIELVSKGTGAQR
jgi:hypothetical protein